MNFDGIHKVKNGLCLHCGKIVHASVPKCFATEFIHTGNILSVIKIEAETMDGGSHSIENVLIEIHMVYSDGFWFSFLFGDDADYINGHDLIIDK
jgi:hypothetical protein